MSVQSVSRIVSLSLDSQCSETRTFWDGRDTHIGRRSRAILVFLQIVKSVIKKPEKPDRFGESISLSTFYTITSTCTYNMSKSMPFHFLMVSSSLQTCLRDAEHLYICRCTGRQFFFCSWTSTRHAKSPRHTASSWSCQKLRPVFLIILCRFESTVYSQ